MVHKESIGRVMGEAGKTYIPSVNDNGDGTFSFSFSEGNETDINNGVTIKAPYVIPYVHTEGGNKYLKFRVDTEEEIDNISIPYSDLKGEDGIATIDVQAINLNNYDNISTLLDELSLSTIYIDIQNDDDNNDNIDSNINAYIVYEDPISHQRKLEQINSVISFDNFYTKDEIDTKYSTMEAYVQQQVAGVINEQQQINELLNDGYTIEEEDYTLNNNVVNVMSDASIEDVKSQIYEELKEYVKESDIVFNEETGALNIKY